MLKRQKKSNILWIINPILYTHIINESIKISAEKTFLFIIQSNNPIIQYNTMQIFNKRNTK